LKKIYSVTVLSNAVGTASRLRPRRSGVRIPAGENTFFFSETSKLALGPIKPLFDGYRIFLPGR